MFPAHTKNIANAHADGLHPSIITIKYAILDTDLTYREIDDREEINKRHTLTPKEYMKLYLGSW